ncbi:hypothetical protein T265_10893 [Opisthorchis viverrini]|uniref:Uncharacterized protein n=1 Tax=Opisthorchis viverrini TaxID=6198 RepID=A0A074ZZJ8_OPIVI|nr:hypothetical protein T265_10893 [Opisthorchis viverrini]KER20594.1 hypothetical protein T265_10893 [Opisthorchis viverrini]
MNTVILQYHCPTKTTRFIPVLVQAGLKASSILLECSQNEQDNNPKLDQARRLFTWPDKDLLSKAERYPAASRLDVYQNLLKREGIQLRATKADLGLEVSNQKRPLIPPGHRERAKRQSAKRAMDRLKSIVFKHPVYEIRVPEALEGEDNTDVAQRIQEQPLENNQPNMH